MKYQIRIIAVALLAAVAGLTAGYFLFKADRTETHDDHQHGVTDETLGTREAVWTCSMHPQIRQNEPGKCPICEMDLIPLDQTGSSDPTVLEMTVQAAKLANIQTTIVGAASRPEKVIALTGKIQEDERMAASQVAHIPGRIEQLFVSFTGEPVQKGQKLAVIYSPQLITAQRELLEALKFKDVNTSLAEAARKKLEYWKIPQSTIERIEAEGKIQENFTLLSDVSGVVSNRRVSVGDHLMQGQILFDVINLSKLWVLFDAYEEDLANIRIGDPVSFTTPSLPDRTFRTRISYIDPVINPQTRVAALRGEINNQSGLLKPEMFVRGIIQSRLSTKEKLSVPKSAVLWTGQRSVVYVKLADRSVPSFQYREVLLGDGLGDSYLVESGIEAGEEVVTYGNFAIDAAAQLNNQMSMMNRLVSLKGVAAPPAPDFRTSTPEGFQQQLERLLNRYLQLKDRFVASDAPGAAQAATGFLDQLKQVDMDYLKGDAHLQWMEYAQGLTDHATLISQSNEIQAQRKQFSFLSNLMIRVIQSFGAAGGPYYIQHCPMAMDNEGADWISREENILNPYFGEEMLTCGNLKGELPQDKQATLRQ